MSCYAINLLTRIFAAFSYSPRCSSFSRCWTFLEHFSSFTFNSCAPRNCDDNEWHKKFFFQLFFLLPRNFLFLHRCYVNYGGSTRDERGRKLGKLTTSMTIRKKGFPFQFIRLLFFYCPKGFTCFDGWSRETTLITLIYAAVDEDPFPSISFQHFVRNIKILWEKNWWK